MTDPPFATSRLPRLPRLPPRPRARQAAAASALALLAACAAGPQAPASGGPAAATGPRARLLLRGAVPSDDQNAVVELTDAQNCKDPRMLSSGDARRAPAPATLAAGLLTTLDFVVLRTGKPLCVVRWSFTPEADKTYLVQGLVVAAAAPPACWTPPSLTARSPPVVRCSATARARPAWRWTSPGRRATTAR